MCRTELHQGDILSQYCKAKGWTATALAIKLKVSRVYVYDLFKKQYLPAELIDRAAGALGVSPAVFFTARQSTSFTLLLVAGVVNVNGNPVLIKPDDVIFCHPLPGADKTGLMI